MSDATPQPEPQTPPVIVMPELKHTERKSGCFNLLGCIAKMVLALALIATPVLLVWWWHPWQTVSEPVAVEGACPDGQRGMRSVDHLEVLGIRVWESGSALICVDQDEPTDK